MIFPGHKCCRFNMAAMFTSSFYTVCDQHSFYLPPVFVLSQRTTSKHKTKTVTTVSSQLLQMLWLDYEMVKFICLRDRYNRSLRTQVLVSCCTLNSKLSSSFKKLLLNEHKNIFAQRNTGVFILGASCLKIGGELSGANCPGGELSDIQMCTLARSMEKIEGLYTFKTL